MAALFFSCTKADEDTITPTPTDQTDPAAEPASDGNLLTRFGVSFEDDSRVTVNLDSGVTAIETGDEVLVFVSAGNSAIYVYDGTAFVLKGGETAVALDAPASVFYPADEFELSGSNVLFTMPNGVVADAEGFGAINPMAGVISGSEDSYTVELGNLASVLRVKVSADVNINSVTLDYGSMVYYAAGAKFIVDASTKAMTYNEASDDTDETVILGTPATSADVLFLLPTVGLANGLTVTANLAENHNGGADTFTVTNANTTARDRNMISTMSFKAKLFDGGLGTGESPYLIASAKDFKYFQKYTAEGYTPGSKTAADFLGAHYLQTADIDFNNASLSAIGAYNTNPFSGTYDGNDKKLQKFSLTGSNDSSAGLFEYVSGGTLKNIKLANARMTAPNTAGLLAGRCVESAKIQDCTLDGGQIEGRNSVGFIAHITGSVAVTGCSVKDLTIITAASGSADANNQGGVVGYAGGSSSIESCSTSGEIQFTGTASGVARGGIVGKFDSPGKVKGCTNAAAISSLLVNYAGGIAGQLTKGTITECVGTGDVTGLGYVGGITGAMLSGSSTCVYVNKCRVNAAIKGTGTANANTCVGGIVGSMQNGVLNTCFAKGSVENSWYDTGGIAGQIYANGSNANYNRPYVFDCIAANDVKCTRSSGSANIGGVVGRIIRNSSYTEQYTAVDNCLGLNQTITATIQYAGAFVGYVNASATNNNRVRVRNCISLVDDSHLEVNTSANYTGGFAGAYLGALIHCYYLVSDNKQTAVSGTTAASNLTKSDLATLTSSDFCNVHSARATGYNLTVNGTKYNSSGWTKPVDVDYPVPTTLSELGAEYYK